jgi:hypothetical protein
MARKPGTKKPAKKAVRKARAAKKKVAKKAARKAKASSKKPAKKAASRKVRKASPRKAGKTAAPTAARKPVRKASAKRPAAKRRAAASSAPPATTPKLPAHRPLTAGVVLRSQTGALPRGPERASGKPGRALRKVNLRTGIARPIRRSSNPEGTKRPQGPWPTPGEAASETALRERILVCLIAFEGELAGRPAGDSSVDAATAARCVEELRGWLSASCALRDGRILDRHLFESLVTDELAMLRETLGSDRFEASDFSAARERLLQATLPAAGG